MKHMQVRDVLVVRDLRQFQVDSQSNLTVLRRVDLKIMDFGGFWRKISLIDLASYDFDEIHIIYMEMDGFMLQLHNHMLYVLDTLISWLRLMD